MTDTRIILKSIRRLVMPMVTDIIHPLIPFCASLVHLIQIFVLDLDMTLVFDYLKRKTRRRMPGDVAMR